MAFSNLIWPQRPNTETTMSVRLGRVLHWIATGIGVIPIAVLIYGYVAWGSPGRGEHIALIGLSLIFLIVGRALRYVVSNE